MNLQEFYARYGAKTTQEKINNLTRELGESNFYVCGGRMTDAIKLDILEQNYLECNGLEHRGEYY